MADDSAKRPLDGIRVLDLSRMMAGPTTTMHLADFGAEVIKIEKPKVGDELRRWGHLKDGLSLAFKALNRNKSFVTLDIACPEGQEVFKRMVEHADVVVEGFRPGTMEKWGLGYDVLSAINPKLIMMRICGFGQTGPYSRRRGFGTIAEAMSGYISSQSLDDGTPRMPTFGFGDVSTGIFAAFGILLALYNRDANGGTGQFIDLALYEGLLAFFGLKIVDFQQLGIGKSGDPVSAVAPRNTYKTRDGVWLALSGGTNTTFRAISEVIRHPELATNEKFSTIESRLAHADELDQLIKEYFSVMTWDEVDERNRVIDAPIFPVYDLERVVSDPHIRQRGSLREVEDPDVGCTLVASPVPTMSETPGRVEYLARELGRDNTRVYGQLLNLDADGLGSLTSRGVV